MAWSKIAECGALATNNPNSGVVLLEFDHNGFTITPMCKYTKATPQTVFAHMLYENADPYILLEPGGYLDVSNAKYKKYKKRINPNGIDLSSGVEETLGKKSNRKNKNLLKIIL